MPNSDPTVVIVPQSAALSAARLRAERAANASGDVRFVIAVDGDFRAVAYVDLRTHYYADVLAGRVVIVYTAQPGPPVVEPDVSFAACGWE